MSTFSTGKGWLIRNCGGWNDYKTARTLSDNEDSLPLVPDGYGVLCAPVDTAKPFGLRCAIVRDIPFGDEETEASSWALDNFDFRVEVLYSFVVNHPDDDAWLSVSQKIGAKIEELCTE